MSAIEQLLQIIFIFLGLGLALPVYLIPSIIATRKKKNSAGAIIAVNLALGWTFLGYLLALVWALTNDKKEQQIVIQSTPTPTPPVAPEKSLEEQLLELRELVDKGLLTEEEYSSKRAKILS